MWKKITVLFEVCVLFSSCVTNMTWMPVYQIVQSNHPPLLLFCLVKAKNLPRPVFILKSRNHSFTKLPGIYLKLYSSKTAAVFRQQKKPLGRLAFINVYQKIHHTQPRVFEYCTFTTGFFLFRKQNGKK